MGVPFGLPGIVLLAPFSCSRLSFRYYFCESSKTPRLQFPNRFLNNWFDIVLNFMGALRAVDELHKE